MDNLLIPLRGCTDSDVVKLVRLSQQEADELMRMKKQCIDDQNYLFPSPGDKTRIPLMSMNEDERFVLDINRTSLRKVFKCTYQERYGGDIVLVRLDLHPKPHRNPYVLFPPTGFGAYNGIVLDSAHIHIYKEGWDVKWAMPADGFFEPTSIQDMTENLRRFFIYCNIVLPPNIQRPLI